MNLSNENRTFVIGDIHGAHKALLQCFEKARFDYQHDLLICLGDICDGWPQVKESFDELRKIKNLILLLGNHDEMALQWMMHGVKMPGWLMQGGRSTINSFGDHPEPGYAAMISNAGTYYERDNKLFVHAGCTPGKPLNKHTVEELIWNRSLADMAIDKLKTNRPEPLTGYNEIYVGHTPTIRVGHDKPFNACEVWFMDTGAGWHGRLSMMNIETKEVFQSDPVPALYPEHPGRV